LAHLIKSLYHISISVFCFTAESINFRFIDFDFYCQQQQRRAKRKWNWKCKWRPNYKSGNKHTTTRMKNFLFPLKQREIYE